MAQVLIRADALQEGDMVDLQGDPFADPRNDTTLAFAFEYAVVCSVVHEHDASPPCIAIGFEGFDVVGFPPDHMLRVSRPYNKEEV